MSESPMQAWCSGRKYELALGDCLRVMRTFGDGRADAVIMDPPYTSAGSSTNGRNSAADTQFFLHWLRDVMAQVRRVVKPTGCGFVFCDWRTVALVAEAMRPDGNRQTEEVWSVSQALVWDRESIGLGSPFRNSFEMIAFVRGPAWRSELPRNIPTVIRHHFPYGRHENHGAEKPVDLCRQLVRWALPTQGLVLDPFAGSGTIGVAALAEGREYLGIELERSDYETAKRRIAMAEIAPPQETLFAPAAEPAA